MGKCHGAYQSVISAMLSNIRATGGASNDAFSIRMIPENRLSAELHLYRIAMCSELATLSCLVRNYRRVVTNKP